MDTVKNLVRQFVEAGDKFTIIRGLAEEVFGRNTPSGSFRMARKLFADRQSSISAKMVTGSSLKLPANGVGLTGDMVESYSRIPRSLHFLPILFYLYKWYYFLLCRISVRTN
jgi:hypothetical protein